MRNLLLAILCFGCSDPGRQGGTTAGGSTAGTTGGGTTGGGSTTAGTTGGGTTGSYNGPDMALPTLPFDSTVTETGAPADAPNQFGGAADPAAAPALVYPPDGLLIPPNLNEMEIQFVPANGTSLFEIAFTGPNNLNLRVYTTCTTVGQGCGYTPEAVVWNTLEAAARDNTITITIRATTTGGGSVGTSVARKLSFAREDLEGGLYYWAAAAGAVNRYDFGRRGQTAEPFYTTAQSGAICVGCHALSRDGSRIALGLNAPTPATLRVLDVASRGTLYESAAGFPGSGGGSNFEALSPDGLKVLTSESNNLVLHDSGSGSALGATIMNANMPDWSGDGSTVVFARGGGAACPLGLCASQPGVDSASLFTVPWNGSAFGSPLQLVQGSASSNNYYPALSPDGKWVAFNQSGTNSFDAPDAKVLVVNAAGGNPSDLTAVNSAVGNSWPKFAPFVHTFQGKTIFWLTFSSRRDYGLRLLNSQAPDKDHEVAQVWMVAVSPDRLNTPGDGGYPPFRLPFQDITTGNHIAQWTEKVARMGCTDDMQCMMGEFCEGGECVPPVK
jgi:hypothetical protein